MKYTLAALAFASLMSSAANAGTIQGEVRLGGVAKGQANSTEYKAEYSDSFAGLVNYGAELQVKQAANAGALDSKVSVKLGPNLDGFAFVGLKPTAYVELGESQTKKTTTVVAGRSTTTGGNFEFWGAGVKAKRDLYGPLSLSTGYRHREGFGKDAKTFVENRLNAGVGYALNDSTTLGATYYRTTGTYRYDQVGLSVTKSF